MIYLRKCAIIILGDYMKGCFVVNNTKYKILHAFKKNNECYVIYTDNDDIMANKYEIIDNKINLLPIDDYSIVEKEWDKINE